MNELIPKEALTNEEEEFLLEQARESIADYIER